jgi:predicted nucleotidyltransferase component of viral defense system
VVVIDIAKSVLQKLKNKSRKSGLSFQLILQLFCQEEFLRRLSYSEFQNSLVLKGGLFLFVLSNFESRPTMDIDFLMRNQSNENEKVLDMVQKIIATETTNSFINFEIRGVSSITEHKQYHGARVKMIGIIGNTHTPFDIDFRVGDIIIPKPDIRKLTVQLEDYEKAEVLTYSLESTIAEKWDAIIDRMEFNSRMKDFYDIYYLACHYEFEGRKLQEAIFETLDNSGRIYEKDTLDKVRLLSEDDHLLAKWKAFVNNSIKSDLDFDKVLETVNRFIGEPFEAMVYEREFFGKWDILEGKWLNIL